MERKYKLLVIGHMRHGKDTVAEIFQEFGLTYKSSSEFCAEQVVFPVLGPRYNYSNYIDCFNDRSNHRKEWFDLISDYNSPDKSKLGRSIFGVSDIYCGLRNKDEFNAMKENMVFDFSIWVDRLKHLPPESKDSMTLDASMADYIIDNNGSLVDLKENVRKFYEEKMK